VGYFVFFVYALTSLSRLAKQNITWKTTPHKNIKKHAKNTKQKARKGFHRPAPAPDAAPAPTRAPLALLAALLLATAEMTAATAPGVRAAACHQMGHTEGRDVNGAQ